SGSYELRTSLRENESGDISEVGGFLIVVDGPGAKEAAATRDLVRDGCRQHSGHAFAEGVRQHVAVLRIAWIVDESGPDDRIGPDGEIGANQIRRCHAGYRGGKRRIHESGGAAAAQQRRIRENS